MGWIRTGGESGHLLKMCLLALGSFLAGVLIHLQCPDPPRLTVDFFLLRNKLFMENVKCSAILETEKNEINIGATKSGDFEICIMQQPWWSHL